MFIYFLQQEYLDYLKRPLLYSKTPVLTMHSAIKEVAHTEKPADR